MNLFALFLLACFAGGILLRERPAARFWLLCGLVLFVALAYFFANSTI